MGYSPWDHKESGTADRSTFSLSPAIGSAEV